MRNLKKLTRKELEFINGGNDLELPICDLDGNCPPGFPITFPTYCENGICYRGSRP
ncbi:hypothetical protein M2347_000303 [Chryseobacterium sp. H1D6B]|uniref:bacteriocin-like protein n=1 Tax=Chryseobacterium sp. H1D6B TaxID=2940588 RepID=UPI0015CB61CE|nr:hypothetical protein [Chryseobacterium sp. H1D6B]MDH6250576.1 hypothetical protein [Chryseobacterium sp. H1D6B]